MNAPRPESPPADLPRRVLARDRLVAAVLAPVLALMAFGAYVVNEKLDAYRHSAELLAVAQLARTGHELARQVEDERNLSALWVGGGRADDEGPLIDQRSQTDTRLVTFRQELEQPPIRRRLGTDSPERALDELEAVRSQVDGDAGLETVLEGYGRLVTAVTAIPYRLVHPASTDLIVACADLETLKDHLLRERALGLSWLMAGRGDRRQLDQLIAAIAETRAYAATFLAHATAAQRAAYESVARGPAAADVARLRRKAIAGRLVAADGEAWERSLGALAEEMSRVEEALTDRMERTVLRQLRIAQHTFYAVLTVVLALVGFAMTALRRSERRAVLAEEAARKLFRAVEQSPVSVMITDTTGRIEYVNPAFTAMTGFRRDEAVGGTPRLLRSEQMPDEVFAGLWQTIRSGQDWRGEICNRRKDGTLYWEQMTVAPVRGANGEVVNFIALKEDVTEVKSLRQAVELEHANILRIIEAIHDGIALMGPDQRFQYTNPALLAEFGPIDGQTGDQYFGASRTGRAPGQPPADTLRREWRSPNSGRIYELTATPVNNPDGTTSTLEVFHDITVRKRAEEALESARNAAEIANRAKSEFLSAMSHELRTPLNAIIGFSEIMIEQLLGPLENPQYLSYAADINQSGRHLLQLINDVLDVARIEVGTVTLHEEEMDVAATLKAAIALVRDRAERDALTLNVGPAENLPLLWADPRRVKQVLVNLLGNAVKFTPSGGRVTLSARMRDSGALELAVADTGIGIAAEDIPKVMTPFGQADSGMARRYGGSGLGLPLSRQFMELHGGSLSLESTPGQGTTVRLTFPKSRLRPGGAGTQAIQERPA